MLQTLIVAAGLLGAAFAAMHDTTRAEMSAPRPPYTASSSAGIRALLHGQLTEGMLKYPSTLSCSEFSLDALATIEQAIHQAHDKTLTSNLSPTDGRRRHASLETATLFDELDAEAKYVASNPETIDAVRDGRCANIGMRWIHHLTDEGRAAVTEVIH